MSSLIHNLKSASCLSLVWASRLAPADAPDALHSPHQQQGGHFLLDVECPEGPLRCVAAPASSLALGVFMGHPRPPAGVLTGRRDGLGALGYSTGGASQSSLWGMRPNQVRGHTGWEGLNQGTVGDVTEAGERAQPPQVWETSPVFPLECSTFE